MTIRVGLRNLSSRQWSFLVLLFVSVFVCYSPVLVNSYAFTDDYSLFHNALLRVFPKYQIIASGRPTYAFLLEHALTSLKGIGDLRYIRFIGVLGIALLAGAIAYSFRKAGWNKWQSVLAAFLICTLPSFQVVAAWAATAFFS